MKESQGRVHTHINIAPGDLGLRSFPLHCLSHFFFFNDTDKYQTLSEFHTVTFLWYYTITHILIQRFHRKYCLLL